MEKYCEYKWVIYKVDKCMDTFYIRIFYYSISQGFNVHINIVPSALPRDIQEWSPHHEQQQNRTPEMAQQKIVKVCPTSSSTGKMEGNGIETKRNSDMNFQLAILSPMY